MRRINTATRAVDLFGAGKDGFKDGNLGLGVAPTDFNADWPNQVQEEIANVIEGAGLVLNGAVQTQLWQAIRKLVGTQNVVAFTAGGNWTVPANVYRIRCRVWGAGGGGGGTSNGGAAGGAGGGYAEGWYTVTPGQVLAVTIGTGGNGGSGAPTAGGAGGSTSIGSLLSASGGNGGNGAGGGSNAGVNTGVGTGTGGQININGQPATSGFTVGTLPLGSGGGGAFCTSLVGGFTGSSGNGAGFPGGGGGGAGGTTNAAGAAGANGYATIEW